MVNLIQFQIGKQQAQNVVTLIEKTNIQWMELVADLKNAQNVCDCAEREL